MTSQVKGYPFEVVLPAECKSRGAVLADQVESLDCRVRRVRFAASAPSAIVQEVTARILVLVDPEGTA